MSTGFNLFDLIFMALGAIFIITAFFRGFVKELFSLFNWVVAFVLSYLLAPFVSKFFNSDSISSSITDIGVRSVIFVTVFFVTMLSTSSICKEFQKRTPDAFDKSLGVLYGITKTLLVFGIIYAVFINSVALFLDKKIDKNSKEYPKFLKEARFHDIVKFSGNFVNPLVEKFLKGMTSNFEKTSIKQEKITDVLDKKIEDIIDEKSEEIIQKTDEINEEMGYEKKDIEKMNRLIEIIDN